MAADMAITGLIYQRERLRGEKEVLAKDLAALEQKAERQRRQLASLDKRSDTLRDRLARADENIAALTQALACAFQFTKDDGVSRKTYPKSHLTGWGGLTRAVLAVFKERRIATADEIAAAVAQILGVHLDDEVSWQKYRRKIGRLLNNIGHQGHIRRLHNVKGNTVGIWALKDSDA